MALNIKTEEASRLAKELAALTGETLTKAVTEAIRERLQRKQSAEGLAEQLLAIGKDCAGRMSPESRALDPNLLLHNERGLPK